MTLCNKWFKHARWDFSPPAALLKQVRLCCAFRSPFHPLDPQVPSWRSILWKGRGLRSTTHPRAVSAAALRALGRGVLASAVSLAVMGQHRLSSLETTLLWAVLRKPSLVLIIQLTPAGLRSRVKVTTCVLAKASVSPGFAVLVLRVVGRCSLPVRWGVGSLLPGWEHTQHWKVVDKW